MRRNNTNPQEACVPRAERENSRTWSYIWLAYSGFYFIDPLLRRSFTYWMETLGLYALFLAIYIAIAKVTARRIQFLLVAALFLMGLLDYPRNEGASTFFIYFAGFLPFMIESTAWFAGLVAIDCLVLIAEGIWLIQHPLPGEHANNPINLATSVFFVLVVGASNLVVAQQKRADRRLRKAEREIVQLEALAERERIARDLHDVLGHTLSVIVLKAELAGRLIERDPERAAAEIGDVERTARTALAEVREAIGGYRAKGLHAELQMARRTLDAAGVALTLEAVEIAGAQDAAGAPASLDQELQTVLALTLREAVTNIVRHAGATQCTVSFRTLAGHHALSIEDNGRHAVLHEGNGLRGMRERVQRIGGHFAIDVDERSGTRVRVEVPAVMADGIS